MTDHLVIDASITPPVIRCLHCGAWRRLDLPMPTRRLTLIEREWSLNHRRCKPSSTSCDQLELMEETHA